jgi:hypothetical protein
MGWHWLRHEWTPWRLEGSLFDTSNNHKVGFIQVRHCKVCNLHKRKRWTIWS